MFFFLMQIVDVEGDLTDALPEAQAAIVFFLICVNEGWKMPVDYFLGKGLLQKSNLVQMCLKILHDAVVTI